MQKNKACKKENMVHVRYRSRSHCFDYQKDISDVPITEILVSVQLRRWLPGHPVCREETFLLRHCLTRSIKRFQE